jgi:hypothetical protein
MTNKRSDSEPRRRISKTGAAALRTGLAGCQDMLYSDDPTSTSTESPTVTQNSTENPIETPTEEPTETPTEMMTVEESHERRQRFWSYIPCGTDVPYLDHNTITQPEVLMSN